jgi:hypothetical protein
MAIDDKLRRECFLRALTACGVSKPDRVPTRRGLRPSPDFSSRLPRMPSSGTVWRVYLLLEVVDDDVSSFR